MHSVEEIQLALRQVSYTTIQLYYDIWTTTLLTISFLVSDDKLVLSS